ncbi:MAG: ribosome biogenesis GTPase Der [Candidatus Limnocylindria bacterium]|nr:ribosome biogenesis GTPase Der [Chloroflexota bacterium]MDQ3401736.1 ribosome biogenesis GTPase Der [Chloroflexota bacterium]
MPRGVVAVVGRPNVGKSTLFNRLVGERLAIVEDLPGTTRDRLYGSVEWRGREFSLVDTGGLDEVPGPRGRDATAGVAGLEDSVRRQADVAIDEADLVLFIVDAKDGILPIEQELAGRLRRSGKATLLVANKADGWRGEAQAAEFYQLGLGDLHTVSAIQGHGTGDLLDAIVERLPPDEAVEDTAAPRIAVVGRPNVGKSSFLNSLAGFERAVVSDLPGTTRDTTNTTIERNGRPVVLVDTAGIRRRGRVEQGIESYALLRTARALEHADVAILLVDANEGVTAQDVHVAGYAIEAGVGIVVGLNKWDLVDRSEENTEHFGRVIAREFHFAPWISYRFVSAKTGRNVETVLADAVAIVDRRKLHVATSDLHRLLVEAIAAHPPPTNRGQPVRFHHVTQADTRTPTFVFFVDRPDLVHFSYQRYLDNRIREKWGFAGTPIRIQMRGARE